MPFIALCCLIAEARNSNTMLKNSGEIGHPWLVPDLRGKALSFSSLTMILAVDLSYIAFMTLWYDPSIPTFEGFYQDRMLYFVKWFLCIYWEYHMVHGLSFIDVMNHIDVLQILSQPCIPGVNPTWSWWIIFLMYCWIQLANILWRIFASMFIREIGL